MSGHVKIKFDREDLHRQVPELVDIAHLTGDASCAEGSDELVLQFADGKEISIRFDKEWDCIVVDAD